MQRREPNLDIDDAEVDAGLWIIRRIASDEIGLSWRRALKGAFNEQLLHERADARADLGPERLAVRFKYDPLQARVKARLEEQREPPHRHIFPLRASLIGAEQRARAPDHVAGGREMAQAVDSLRN
jgi:hypothetical protein